MTPNPPDKPDRPQASRLVTAVPFYYGWLVLAAGTLGLAMTMPGQTVGVSVFLDKIVADLNVSRSAVSLLYMVGTLGGSLSLPFIGRFIDRRGPRLAVVAIAGLFALACVWMGLARGLLMLGVGFLAIRGLGQGSLSLVSTHVINLWFVRRRGFALSLSGLGMAASISLFPLYIELLLTQFGWRIAYVLLGVTIALTILPVGAIVFRSQPERYGLQPDSAAATPAEMDFAERSVDLAQARRTTTFWLFALGNFCVAALITGLVFHHYSILAASDVDRTAAAIVFTPFGIVAAAANFVTGLLLDRTSPRFLLCAMLLALAVSLFVAPQVTQTWALLTYGSLLGLVQGMAGVLQSGVYAYYFGRSHLGTISGFASTIAVAGTSFGPILFALGFERSGSYAPILALSASLPLLLAIAAVALELTHRDKSVL